MSLAVAGCVCGVNKSMTHFVRKTEDKPVEVLNHPPNDCVCRHDLFLENTESAFSTWMEDQSEDVVAPRKVYKDMQKKAVQSKATFFA
jgi:hypothetical protein